MDIRTGRARHACYERHGDLAAFAGIAAGVDVLRAGGSAVDAAMATSAVLSVSIRT